MKNIQVVTLHPSFIIQSYNQSMQVFFVVLTNQIENCSSTNSILLLQKINKKKTL